MPETITVFRGASQLGAQVVRALSHDYDVRIATSYPEVATAVPSGHVTTLKVDLDDPKSIEFALSGSYGCFAMTVTDFENPHAYQIELEQGKRIADACEKLQIRHLVFSTQLSVVRTTGLRAQHMDAKADVEAYMKHLGLAMTSVIVPTLYEDILSPPLRPQRAGPDLYQLGIPMGTLPLDLISVEDVGQVVRSIFCMGKPMIYKTISLTGDKISIKDMALILNKYLSPKKFKDQQVTVEQFRQEACAGAEDLSAMFDFYTRVDQRASVDTTKRLNPAVQSFPEWVHSHAKAIHKALDYPSVPQKDIWA